MFRKMLAVFTTLTATLLVVGVAWAGGDDTRATIDSNSSASLSPAASTSLADGSPTSSSVESEGSSSTSLDDDGSTSTTIDDGQTNTTIDGGSTSTSLDDSRSTTSTIDDSGSTSTTVDDHDDDRRVADGSATYAVGAAGNVSIQVLAGRLILVDVSVNSGWQVEVKKVELDRIEVRFTNNDSEARIKIELDHGGLEVDVETN